MLPSKRTDIDWKDRPVITGSNNPNYKGGVYLDDKGYIRVLVENHPFGNKGYVYAHRLVLEEFLGRFLSPDETVHHINEIKVDNRLENLFLTTPKEHSIIHKSGQRWTQSRRTKQREEAKKRSQTRKRNVAGQFEKS